MGAAFIFVSSSRNYVLRAGQYDMQRRLIKNSKNGLTNGH